ncbi:ATP-binding protein [Pelagibius sp. 7325]|uniref:sensor histidine kinase n=1 Tax=Pelagibius sp. 7325 TaxID=3131994 RepID=UPI0030EC7D84
MTVLPCPPAPQRVPHERPANEEAPAQHMQQEHPATPKRPTLRGLLWPLGLLTAGLVAVILVLLLFAAREQNELARKASEHLATAALNSGRADIESNTRDYAFWDDAADKLVLTLDEAWADANIGTWAYEGLEMDATLLLDGQGGVVYAMADGERLDAEILQRVSEGLGPLTEAARVADPGSVGVALSGYVVFDGAIALAAAAPISWQDGRRATQRGGAQSVLVYLQRLDSGTLAALEESFLLTGLHLTGPGTTADTAQADAAADTASVTLFSYDSRPLARLVWTAEQPGFLMLHPLLLPGTAAALIGLGLLGVVIRRTAHTMRQLEASHAALQQQAAALAGARDRAEQQHRTEAELRHSAVAASRAKSEFLALVSHELRTPLNAILGFSESIATQAFGQGVNDRYRNYAEHIHESGSHLLSIINDILDLSKIEAGRYELHEEEIELGDLLGRCVALLRERAATRGVILACPQTDIRLWADARALKQIVFNLMSNAIKFTGPGGRVELSAGGDGAGIRIAVSDTGIGMSAEDLARALQPFGQAASAHTRTVEGTGLGLNVTQALAQLHGGRLAIHSTAGEGTTAVVQLPATRRLPSRPAAAPGASA